MVKRRPAYPMQCARWGADYVNVDDIVACFNYLRNLGTQRCEASGDAEHLVSMCTAGAAIIHGMSYIAPKVASSYWYVPLGPCVCVCVSICVCFAYPNQLTFSSDAALGLVPVLDSCTHADHRCAGTLHCLPNHTGPGRTAFQGGLLTDMPGKQGPMRRMAMGISSSTPTST